MSIVKLLHSSEYRKIPFYDSSRRCPLYRSTIFKSWLQLLSVSIFELPNKSLSFRLRHSANEKLFNVYFLHLSIISDLRNSYYKWPFKTIENFRSQNKNQIPFKNWKYLVYTGNRSLICWQKYLNLSWFAWIRKKTNAYSEYGFRPRSDPCETRFVGTHQPSQGLNIHQGLKIRYICTH
jgi:hypothetical protein